MPLPLQRLHLSSGLLVIPQALRVHPHISLIIPFPHFNIDSSAAAASEKKRKSYSDQQAGTEQGGKRRPDKKS